MHDIIDVRAVATIGPVPMNGVGRGSGIAAPGAPADRPGTARGGWPARPMRKADG